jgi:hypothetical protein
MSIIEHARYVKPPGEMRSDSELAGPPLGQLRVPDRHQSPLGRLIYNQAREVVLALILGHHAGRIAVRRRWAPCFAFEGSPRRSVLGRWLCLEAVLRGAMKFNEYE